MNDEKGKSSSQNPLNTTHFNKGNVLGNSKKFSGYSGIRPLNMPRNKSIGNDLEKKDELEKDSIPKKSEEKHVNLSNEERKKQSRNYLDNSINETKNKPLNQFGPKNRINNSVNNLRNTLGTNPSIKDDLVKKGTEALKNSANPYAKAAGYAASYMQKRKEKQQEKEENKEPEPEENNVGIDEETTTSEKRGALIRMLLPILMFIAPFILILLIILCIIAPILNAYSWFYSIFNHKSTDAESYYIYKNDEKTLQEEKEFNEAIVGSEDGSVTGIIQKYKDEYGVTLDRHLLVATVTYKYTLSNSTTDKDESSEEISEEDINQNLEDLEKEDNEESTEEEIGNKIDYKSAKEQLETVAKLMIAKDGDTYKTNFEVGGLFYNNLIESNFLKTYYKDFLINTEYETKKELVDKIYDYANGSREIFGDDELDEDPSLISGGVVGDLSNVHVQTCAYPYKFKTISDLKVYDNTPWNEGTSYPDTLTMQDYLKGVLMGEVGGHIDSRYIEGLKAQTVAALSFIINDKESGFDLKSGEMYFPGGNCRQLTCSPTDGCTYIKGKVEGKYGSVFAGPNRFGGEGRNIKPLSSDKNAILDKVMSDVFGNIMVKKGITSASFSGSKDTIHASYYDSTSTGGCVSGKCFGQQEAMKDAENGMTYDKILHKYYSDIDFDIINIVEGQYTESAEYADAKYNGKVIYYSQTDYKNSFCGRSNATISSAGCGVTSAAIVASSLTGNKKYDPVYMMEWAHRTKDCGSGISGTDPSFFKVFAEELGFNYEKVGKNGTDKVVNALKSGKALVIAHMGEGHFTNGGHYIVLSAINSEGKVYVNDPNHNKHTGYWNINLIANELSGKFHIISLK